MSTAAGPALQIFLPYWGDPGFLYAAVESVRGQRNTDWTLTIVDDCYPDSAVAEHFATERDPRITYLRNATNLGITGNYDHCRDLASADLMMFMGCDDLMHPDFVATVLADHARYPAAAIIQPGVRVIDEHGTIIDPLTDKVKRAIAPRATGPTELRGERLAVSLLGGDWLYWPSLVFRTDRLKRYAFRPGLPIIQDMALVVDMVAAGESLVVDPTVVFSYRRHSQSASGASLLGGRRFTDERAYYALAAAQMRTLGWRAAELAARARWTSRLHSLALLPAAVGGRKWAALKPLLTHTLQP